MSLVQDGTFQGSSGDFVCRSPKWTDVVKFFLLNYGLHAVTVINIPGAGTEGMAFNILAALICPMIGITSAAGAILSRSMLAKEKLVRAQRARALCMLVPWELNEKLGGSPFGWQGVLNVHGQLPFKTSTLTQRLRLILGFPSEGSASVDTEDGSPPKRYGLVLVPLNFRVHPLLNEHEEGRKVEISCEYSVIKSLAAIFQIFYGSFELYQARESQIGKFGYAAYSFTVIPYIMMSFMNLFATICRPTYPAMYLVHYGDKLPQMVDQEGEKDAGKTSDPNTSVVLEEAEGGSDQLQNDEDHPHVCARELEHLVSGAVGCAHRIDLPSSPEPPSKPRALKALVPVSVSLLALLFLAAPTYIIIYLLSGFDAKESTTAQRVWIIASLVSTSASWISLQIVNTFVHFLNPPRDDGKTPPAGTGMRGLRILIPNLRVLQTLRNVYLALLIVPSVGAFVVVGQMIMASKTCVRI